MPYSIDSTTAALTASCMPKSSQLTISTRASGPKPSNTLDSPSTTTTLPGRRRTRSSLRQGTFPHAGPGELHLVCEYGPLMSTATYWKIPFEWTEGSIPVEDDLPDAFSWMTGRRTPAPVDLVATVLETSPGPEDRYAVETLGSELAAQRVLALASGFSYLPERWHVLMVNAEAAGFVLPVIYDGCSRHGLDEATIYHMGVAPTHRGAGLGRFLLRRATRTLVSHGVWRIYCDTAATNEPMIHLFEQEGWIRLPAHERPIF